MDRPPAVKPNATDLAVSVLFRPEFPLSAAVAEQVRGEPARHAPPLGESRPVEVRDLGVPEAVVTDPLGATYQVRLAGTVVSQHVLQPGWSWEEHAKPLVGTASCELYHRGVVLSGRMGVRTDEGEEIVIGPNQVFDLHPGHVTWVEGDEELVGRPWEEVALDALRGALDDLESRFGSDPGEWRWGRVHPLVFPHALGAGSALAGRMFNRRLEVGGGQETIAQVGWDPNDPFAAIWAPCWRMVADPVRPERSRWQAFTGQSGHLASPHYDDLVERHRDVDYLPVNCGRDAVAGSTLHLVAQ